MVDVIQELIDAIATWFTNKFNADGPIVEAIGKIINLIVQGYVDA
jgi:hypothetical protein